MLGLVELEIGPNFLTLGLAIVGIFSTGSLLYSRATHRATKPQNGNRRSLSRRMDDLGKAFEKHTSFEEPLLKDLQTQLAQTTKDYQIHTAEMEPLAAWVRKQMGEP